MTPSHRNLQNLQPGFRREKQKFGIKAKALVRHLLEDRTNFLPPEHFESALRVVDLETQHDAHNPIKNDSAHLAASRLMFFDEGSIDSSGSDDDIGGLSFSGGQELLKFFNRGGEIRVGENDVVTAGVKNAGSNRMSLSMVLFAANEPQSRNRRFAHDGGSLVRRSVVDDNNLRAPGNPFEELLDLSKGFTYA